MNFSNFSHPEKDSIVIIRKWQVEFCKELGRSADAGSAMIGFFDYWHTIRRETVEKKLKLPEHARVPDSQGMYQYHTIRQMEEAMISVAKKDTIMKILKFLVKKQVVEIKKNPNPHLDHDHNWYLFKPAVLKEWLQTYNAGGVSENRQGVSENRQGVSENRTLHSINHSISSLSENEDSENSEPIPANGIQFTGSEIAQHVADYFSEDDPDFYERVEEIRIIAGRKEDMNNQHVLRVVNNFKKKAIGKSYKTWSEIKAAIVDWCQRERIPPKESWVEYDLMLSASRDKHPKLRDDIPWLVVYADMQKFADYLNKQEELYRYRGLRPEDFATLLPYFKDKQSQRRLAKLVDMVISNSSYRKYNKLIDAINQAKKDYRLQNQYQ
jgi:hypothetical protein